MTKPVDLDGWRSFDNAAAVELADHERRALLLNVAEHDVPTARACVARTGDSVAIRVRYSDGFEEIFDCRVRTIYTREGRW